MAAAAAWVFWRVLVQVRAAWPFSTDDGYIPLRYARNWAAGHGLLWNVGEPPVEGYSSFTTVALATGAIRLGIDPMLALKVVGVVSLCGACLLLWALARRWVGPVLAWLPAMVFTSQFGAIWWAVSGMETAIYVCLSLAAVWLFLDGWGAGVATGGGGRGRLAGAGLVAALAGVTRPEGAIVAIVLVFVGVLLLWLESRDVDRGSEAYGRLTRDGVRRLLRFGLAFVLPFGSYFAWRYSYYGRPWSNTVYCKDNALFFGSSLLVDYAAIAWPVALASLLLLRRRVFDARFVAFWLVPLAYASLLISASPAIAYFHRHVLLAYGLLAVLAAVALASLHQLVAKRVSRHRFEVGVFVVVALAVTFLTLGRTAMLKHRSAWYHRRMMARAAAANWINARLGPDEMFACADTGIIGYLARAKVLDTLCLNCGAATRPPISLRMPYYAAYVVARRPRYLVGVSNGRHRNISGWVMARLVETEAFHRLYREVAFFPTTKKNFNMAIWAERERPLSTSPGEGARAGPRRRSRSPRRPSNR